MTVPTWATWSRKGDCYENIRKSHGNLLEEVYRQRKSRDLEAFTTDSEYQLSPLIKFVTFCVIILNIQWLSFLIYKIRIIIIVLISWDYCVLNTYGTALIKCYLKTKVGRKSKLGLRKDWKAVWNAGAISLSQLHFILPVITDKMSLLPIAHEKKNGLSIAMCHASIYPLRMMDSVSLSAPNSGRGHSDWPSADTTNYSQN